MTAVATVPIGKLDGRHTDAILPGRLFFLPTYFAATAKVGGWTFRLEDMEKFRLDFVT